MRPGREGDSHFSAAPVDLWTLNLGPRFWSQLVPVDVPCLPLLEPECLIRTASKLLSFFHTATVAREKGNSVAAELIRECFCQCIFLFLLTPLLTCVSLPIFSLFGFFELCSFLFTVHLGFSSPCTTALPVCMPVCLFFFF